MNFKALNMQSDVCYYKWRKYNLKSSKLWIFHVSRFPFFFFFFFTVYGRFG